MWSRFSRILLTCLTLLATHSEAVRAQEPPGVAPSPAARPARGRPGRMVIDPQAPVALPAALPPNASVPGRRLDPLVRETVPVPAPSPSPLSLARLEELAVQNNPTIRAAEALVTQQQGLLRQLTRYPNPTAGWVQSTPSRRSEGATQAPSSVRTS